MLTPRSRHVRPTPDRVREAVFNILGDYVGGRRVLDLFSGTGALGLEALSRGAVHAVFVEAHPRSVQLIRENISRCGVPRDAHEILPAKVDVALKKLHARGDRFHLVFMDPPYGKGWILRILPLLEPVTLEDAQVVAEHHESDPVPEACGVWERTDLRRYGDTAVSFFRRV